MKICNGFENKKKTMEMEINYVNHPRADDLYYENYLLVSIVLLLPFSKKVDKDLNSKTFNYNII